MAFVTRPALPVTFAYTDASGSSGSSILHLPANTTLADANTKAAALVALLLAVSDCSIVGYSIGYPVTNTTPAAPAAGSRVENKAFFTFRTAAGKVTRMSIPGIAAAVVHPSGGIISDDANVQAVIADVITSGWCDSNGADIVSIVADEQKFTLTTKNQRTSDTAGTN